MLSSGTDWISSMHYFVRKMISKPSFDWNAFIWSIMNQLNAFNRMRNDFQAQFWLKCFHLVQIESVQCILSHAKWFPSPVLTEMLSSGTDWISSMHFVVCEMISKPSIDWNAFIWSKSNQFNALERMRNDFQAQYWLKCFHLVQIESVQCISSHAKWFPSPVLTEMLSSGTDWISSMHFVVCEMISKPSIDWNAFIWSKMNQFNALYRMPNDFQA